MSKTIQLTVNGKQVEVSSGTTLMEAIQQTGEETPVICYHEATTSEGLCRLCVVEVEGWRVLAPACITQAAEGMKVSTNSERVTRSRRTILEMLNARLFGFWNHLGTALRTGEPQNEVKTHGKHIFEELYAHDAAVLKGQRHLQHTAVLLRDIGAKPGQGGQSARLSLPGLDCVEDGRRGVPQLRFGRHAAPALP